MKIEILEENEVALILTDNQLDNEMGGTPNEHKDFIDAYEEAKAILNFKRKMEECNIDTANVLYCPEVPMLGVDKSYVIEEIAGIKVARIIGCEEEI